MNRPYVKQFDANGDLINPINGYFPSKRINKHFPEGFPNRRERRNALVNQPRTHSNKKGTQVVITRIGLMKFTKFFKKFQKIGKKRIIHYTETK